MMNRKSHKFISIHRVQKRLFIYLFLSQTPSSYFLRSAASSIIIRGNNQPACLPPTTHPSAQQRKQSTFCSHLLDVFFCFFCFGYAPVIHSFVHCELCTVKRNLGGQHGKSLSSNLKVKRNK